jgi:membrane-bound serine protease (ClpP class)
MLVGVILGPISSASGQAERLAYQIEVRGPITVVTQSYVERAIAVAERDGAAALVLVLNTPGGGLTTTREIVERMRASTVPIVVYVSPTGATAASAGTVLTLAGHAAAMAPGTSIGAASPVSMEGEMGEVERRKAENILIADLKALTERRSPEAQAWVERAVTESDALSATEALEIGVVDVVAPTVQEALALLDGREVWVAEQAVTLDTDDLEVRPLPQSLIEQFLDTILDPNIAFILLTIGINALLFELSSPGGYIAGILGAICLVLGFFALGVLDVNWTGLALIVLAFVLFMADVMTPSLGVLTALGIVAFTLGALILFSSPLYQVSLSLVITVALVTGAFFLFVVTKAVAAQRRPSATGREALVGAVAQVREPLDPSGMVWVQGELWQARSEAGPIPAGATVRVVAVEGLRLLVEPVSPQAE